MGLLDADLLQYLFLPPHLSYWSAHCPLHFHAFVLPRDGSQKSFGFKQTLYYFHCKLNIVTF